RLRRDDQLVAIRRQILLQHDGEVLLRRAIRRPIVIRQVEVRHAAIKSPPHHRPPRLEDIRPAKVLPKPQRNRSQTNPRPPAAPKISHLVAVLRSNITHRKSLLSSTVEEALLCFRAHLDLQPKWS